MNTLKSLGLVGVAATALFAAQAFACPVNGQGQQTMGSPVCVAPYGADLQGTGLVNILASPSDTTNYNGNSVFSSGPGIDPYTQQVQKSNWSVLGSGGSVATILLQIAAFSGQDTFGIYDPNNINNKLPILVNGQNGYQATLSVFANGGYSVNNPNAPTATFSTTNLFGYYLTTPGGTFYSNPSFNEVGGTVYPDGTPHMVAYFGNGTNTLKPYGSGTALRPGGVFKDEYLLAWEDLPFTSSDLDYNDFVVLVESVHPVPEPAALGMFGLGVLLIGGFVTLRRRRTFNA